MSGTRPNSATLELTSPGSIGALVNVAGERSPVFNEISMTRIEARCAFPNQRLDLG
jgi:hypothetical protein